MRRKASRYKQNLDSGFSTESNRCALHGLAMLLKPVRHNSRVLNSARDGVLPGYGILVDIVDCLHC